MTRSLFRTVWLILIIVLVSISFLLFNNAQELQEKIYRKNAEIARLKVDKSKITETERLLKVLDSRTIAESNTTQLGVLRYLGLEQNRYKVQVLSKQEQTFDTATLSIRKIQIQTNIPYKETLALIDELQNANRLNITKIRLNKYSGFGDKVSLTLEGTLYGLNKNV